MNLEDLKVLTVVIEDPYKKQYLETLTKLIELEIKSLASLTKKEIEAQELAKQFTMSNN